MAKTTTPLFSTEAHGSVSDILSFQRGTNSTTVRLKWVQPERSSPEQRRIRAAFQAASHYYQHRKTTIDANFGAKALARRVTPFNQWAGEFIEVWRRNRILRETGAIINSSTGQSGWNLASTATARGIRWTWNNPAVGNRVLYFIQIQEATAPGTLTQSAVASTGLGQIYLQEWAEPGKTYVGRVSLVALGGLWRRGNTRNQAF